MTRVGEADHGQEEQEEEEEEPSRAAEEIET